jgi:hypothetical protein
MLNGFAMRALFHIHASLILIANYPTLFKKVYDILFVLPKSQLHAIRNAMRIVWLLMFIIGGIIFRDLLMILYLHNESPSYIAPHNKSNQTKLHTG